MNPNRLDGYSVEELMRDVKRGQAHYQMIVNNQEDHLLLLSDEPFSLKHINCRPQILSTISQDILAQFVDTVIFRTPTAAFGSGRVKSMCELFLSKDWFFKAIPSKLPGYSREMQKQIETIVSQCQSQTSEQPSANP